LGGTLVVRYDGSASGRAEIAEAAGRARDQNARLEILGVKPKLSWGMAICASYGVFCPALHEGPEDRLARLRSAVPLVPSDVSVVYRLAD
jgi:hypothetical protein